MTFKWSPELQNYVLTSVHYRPTRILNGEVRHYSTVLSAEAPDHG